MLETKIARVKTLIEQKEAIDAELASLLGGEVSNRKPQQCSICQSTEHSKRTCPQKQT